MLFGEQGGEVIVFCGEGVDLFEECVLLLVAGLVLMFKGGDVALQELNLFLKSLHLAILSYLYSVPIFK